MLKLASVMIGSAKPKELAEFYGKVLGKPAEWEEDGWYGWQMGDSYFMVGAHSGVKGQAKEPQRVIFNLETPQVKRQYERIRGLGAKVVKELYEMEGAKIATFADPEGNYFQLVSPWTPPK